ncbi:MAG: hypothetical protein ACRD12_20495, partial [Acidimicrobiales bacterium]
ALLEPSAATDDPAADAEPDDARRCGSLIVRLDGTATATVIADWMGWTMERAHAALAQLDRRLDRCGLRISADADGHLVVRERARLRTRPRRLPFELVVQVDSDEHRHALAHLVRGDYCARGEHRQQRLLDLGLAVPGPYPGIHPCEEVAAAFAAPRRRGPLRPPYIEIRENGERWPPVS